MYKAFISYSHAADGRLAPALQSALERLAKPWYQVRTFNIFRDEASLSANPHLWSNIQTALQNAEYLIYLASPNSAASKWVQKEVEFWLENKSIEKFLIVLTDGEIVWNDQSKSFSNASSNSLPPALQKVFTEEPFYIDLRHIKKQEDLSLHNPFFKKEVIKLAAPLHGKEPKDLASEEVAAHQKLMRIRNAAIGMLALLFVLACGAAWLANKNRIEAVKERNIAQANFLISEAKGASETDPALAMRLAEQALLLNSDTNIKKAIIKIYKENSFDDIHYLKNYETSENDVLSVAFSPLGNAILVGSWTINGDGNLRLLTLEGNLIREIFKISSFGITSVAFSPDGKAIAAGVTDGITRLWNTQGNLVHELKGQGEITSILFSSNGKMLLTGSKNGSACLWTLDGVLVHVFEGHPGAVNSVALSPDNQMLLTGSDDNTARLWNLKGDVIQTLKGFTGAVQCVAFSKDGKMLFTAAEVYGTDYGTARLWSQKGTIVQDFKMLHGKIECAAFSPDGNFLFTGLQDHKGVLWDMQGNIVKEYRDLFRGVPSACFSPDGRRILIGNNYPCFLDGPLPLSDFLKSNKIKPLTSEQKKQYGIK